jgi:hypothetical protein
MTGHFDEFAKSLAESCTRRESLRAFGVLLAGAVLSRLPVSSAWARGPDACKNFCLRCPKSVRNQCLSACRACSGDTARVCGSCGNYACCAAGFTCCSGACVDRLEDFYNCGACGKVCVRDPNEYGECIDGQCVFTCFEGADRCNGTCTFLDSDPNHCGECGNVCPDSAPFCSQGACIANTCVFPFIPCGGVCVDPTSNRNNCGGCGVQCADDEACISGFCVSG